MEITVPNDWRPRAYQKGLWNFLEKGGKRAVAVWHRRAGKDLLSVNWCVTAALKRKGLYGTVGFKKMLEEQDMDYDELSNFATGGIASLNVKR